MSWDSYIENFKKNPCIADAAIFGSAPGKESCWAGDQTGWLKNITPAEIKVIMSKDHASLFANGLTLAGHKCTLLRDFLHVDGQNTMDLKIKISEKDPDPLPITVGKSHQTLLFAVGVKDTHGGKVNCPVYDMCCYLRNNTY